MKVSIIVPVFNTERYLKQCLESLTSQSLEDIEIICVDNGSTDGSLRVLEELQSEDSSIKIVKHFQGKQGAARNAGLEVATGEYIGFVDSDDYVDTTMFERMYLAASDANADICICNINLFFQNTGAVTRHLPIDWLSKPILSIEEQPKLYRNLTICNKLFNRLFLRVHSINFPEDRFHEDQFFVVQAYTLASSISCIPDALYFYRKQREGAVSANSGKGAFDIFPVMRQMRGFMEQIEDGLDRQETIAQIEAQRYLLLFNTLSGELKHEFFRKMKAELISVTPIKKLDILNDEEIYQYKIIRRHGFFLSLLLLRLHSFSSRIRKAIHRRLDTIQ